MGGGQSKARTSERRRESSTARSLPPKEERRDTTNQASNRFSAFLPGRSRRRRGFRKSTRRSFEVADAAMYRNPSFSSQDSVENRDVDMTHDGDALEGSTSSSSSIRTGRRRTRSVAQKSSYHGNEEDHNDKDAASSPPRRVRRRTQDQMYGVEHDGRSQKGKAKCEDKSSSAETAFTAVEGAQDAADAREVDTGMNGASGSSQAGPSLAEARSTDLSAGTARDGTGQNGNSTTDTHESTSAAQPGRIEQQPQESAGRDTSHAEARHRARLQEIAQALNNGTARRIANAQESGSERPSMLSALLSDILGLRGGRANMPNGARSDTEGQGDRTNEANGESTSRSGTGGTSVIVQGALVSRTLPSRSSHVRSNANSDLSASPEPTVPGPQQQNASSPDTQPGQTERTASLGEGLTGEGEAQAATVEEQASMLVRLLSIAAAATAASLLSSSPVHRPSQAQEANATPLPSHPNANAPSANAATQPSASSSTQAQNGLRPRSASSSSRPLSSASSQQESTSSSAWASQTFQSLRSRIASFGSRLRGQRPSADGHEASPSRRRNSSLGSFGGVRRVFDPPSPLPATANRAGSGDATIRPAEAGDTPTLASLSNMLRDAIREGMHGAGPQGAQQTRSTRPRLTSVEASQAQSRIQSVNATLQAVRDGQLTPGVEGSFDRFLFDLSGDLDSAVRGLPANAEESREDGAALDANTQSRRRRDTQGGQLSFFRLFTFPENRAATVADSSSASLFPCILIGVRTLDPSDVPGSETLAAFAGDGAASNVSAANGAREADGARPDVSDQRTEESGEGQQDRQAPSATETGVASPMSRYLLFVSGGHYPRHHPLFHASNDEASRDVMVLMEFLGAIAAFHVKPTNTVTQEQIAKSSLRNVNGTVREIETLTKLHQVMENTSERCLICLEDWQDEDEERRLLDCGHLFHAPCLDQWLVSSNNSCPLCRRQAVSTDEPDPTAAATGPNAA